MKPKTGLQAKPGDVIVVQGHMTGDPGRSGVILDVLDAASDHEHYFVRWDEEHETLFWPGSDASIRPSSRRRGRRGTGERESGDEVPDREC